MRGRTLLAALALGAGIAYLLDPREGAARRRRLASRVRDRGTSSGTHPGYGMRAGDLAGLEAASLPAQPAWSPRPPLVVLGAGGLLVLFGLRKEGLLAAAARTIGVALLGPSLPAVRGTTAERRRVVDIQHSLHIAAPADEVYAFWDSYESFPLFMTGIREIEDLGGGRSRWVVNGLNGESITWNAVLTQRLPGEVIAWRSEEGSMLDNAGVVRFTPDAGGTRVDLRLCYQPPAGGAGPAVAAILGADPRAKLTRDLGRLKTVLEAGGRSGVHGQESGA